MSAAAASAQAAQQSTPFSKSTIGKRKRQDDAASSTTQAHASRGDSIYDVVDDLLQALKAAYPVSSSILSHDIQSSHPVNKRNKRTATSAADPTKTSIAAQVESKAYQSFEEIADDIDRAVDAFLQGADASVQQDNLDAAASPVQQARSFQSDVHSLLGTGAAHNSRKPLSDVSGNIKHEEQATGNGPPLGRTVLTLFGTSGQGPPRQYFTSVKDDTTDDSGTRLDPLTTAILPNGIFTTNILPSKRFASKKTTKATRTLRDIIPPAPSSLAFKPPTAPPSRATRSQVVEWYRPSTEPPKTRPGAKDIYAEQTLTHGQWLSYLSHADTDETISEKRLKRDRALSGSEGPDESELEFLQQQRNSRTRAKKSSLFRSVFSSFGPTRDDNNAVVPAETRSHIWWDKVGRDLYNGYAEPSAEKQLADRAKAIDPSLLEGSPSAAKDADEFEDAVNAFAHASAEEEAAEKDAKDEDEMLEEITDSIEALIAYQQERHKVLPTGGRSNTSQEPSSAEHALYDMMKGQLALILSQLPPHVVARVNGERLGKLNVSTAISIQVPTYSGIIEEPEKPAAPLAPAAATAPIRPTNPQLASANRVIYQQPAGTPPTRPNPQPPRSAAATTSQYGSRSQIPIQYNQQQSQTVQQPPRTLQYAAQSTQQNGYRQHLANGYQQYGQYANQGAGTPTTRQPHANQYTNRAQAGYQPRSGTYQPQTAQMTPSAAGRSASPQNASSYNAVQNRSAYGTPSAQPATNGQYAASTVRPSSGSNAGTVSTAFSVGNVQFSESELALIEQRRQMKNSPSQPQTPVGQRPPSANGTAGQGQTPKASTNGA